MKIPPFTQWAFIICTVFCIEIVYAVTGKKSTFSRFETVHSLPITAYLTLLIYRFKVVCSVSTQRTYIICRELTSLIYIVTYLAAPSHYLLICLRRLVCLWLYMRLIISICERSLV